MVFSPKAVIFLVLTVGLNLLVTSCGQRRSGGSSGYHGSQMQMEFERAAAEHRIPVRLLMAAGFYESNMSPQISTVPYLNTDLEEEERRDLGFTINETAFGIPRRALGLSNNQTSNQLKNQIHAYAAWLGQELSGYQLPPSLSTPEDYYLWIWQMAQLHRSGSADARNVRTIWARGIIDTLNSGAVWQDPANGEELQLTPVSPPVKPELFPEEARNLFNLRGSQGEIINARRFDLYTHPSNDPNYPDHIKVVHCPMSLSACLEIQNLTDADNLARMRAHYVIPPTDDIVETPLQITPNGYAVELTDNRGDIYRVDNAIVVMLTGNSGRYVGGQRLNADPTWFTPRQLRLLGAVIKDLCRVLSQDSEGELRYADCVRPDGPRGIQFHFQGPNDPTYKWGQIPDFDHSIFHQYLTATETSGEAVFQFTGGVKKFAAKSNIGFKVRFPLSTTDLALQRAVRCPDSRIVWANVRQEQVSGRVEFDFITQIHDAGPNNNGHHFFRVMAYNAQGLTAWAIDDVYIQGYSEGSGSYFNRQACGM